MSKTTNMPETITTQDTGINTTQSRSINFEEDQQDLMKKTGNYYTGHWYKHNTK